MRTVGADRYELESEIARGAIAVVWRAVDTVTGELVAIKQLEPEAAARRELAEGLLPEARMLRDLDHPCVIRLRDVVPIDDEHALVLDYVDGVDVRRRLLTGGPLPPAVAVDVVVQVADALTHVHQRGVVHGDVKPANILVPVDGGPVRLADFGTARRVPWAGRGSRAPQVTRATPEYVAPEIVSGEPPLPAADVYALGVVLYELLCGRSPYRGGPSGDVLRRHLTCAPVPPPGLPGPTWPLITACMVPDPDLRPSALLVARRMRAALPDLQGLAPLAPVGASAVTWRPRGAQDSRPVPAVHGSAPRVYRAEATPGATPAPRKPVPDASVPAAPVPAAPALADPAAPVPADPASPVVPSAAPAHRARPARPAARRAPLPRCRSARTAQPARRTSSARLLTGIVTAAAVAFGLAVLVLLLRPGYSSHPTEPAAVVSPNPASPSVHSGVGPALRRPQRADADPAADPAAKGPPGSPAPSGSAGAGAHRGGGTGGGRSRDGYRQVDPRGYPSTDSADLPGSAPSPPARRY